MKISYEPLVIPNKLLNIKYRSVKNSVNAIFTYTFSALLIQPIS
nr:MAG TPA: hypothetical protein [Caudoviricetes sp.]